MFWNRKEKENERKIEQLSAGREECRKRIRRIKKEMDELIRAVEATGDSPEFVPGTNTRILSLMPNTYLKNPGAYVIKNGDGTEFAYRVEYRNSDGQTVTDDAVALYGDGFTYIVTELYEHRVSGSDKQAPFTPIISRMLTQLQYTARKVSKDG